MEQRVDRGPNNNRFVNPYTFMPPPAAFAERRKPVGHQVLADGRVSGSFDVTWALETPLLCGVRHRNEHINGKDQAVATFARNRDGLVVPGSSLKGAVRSLHETLTGSCMRLVDTDFVPVHREHASTGHRAGWELGLVWNDDGDPVDGDGCPTQVWLAPDVAWIKAAALRRAAPDGLRSTQRFDVEMYETESKNARTQVVDADVAAIDSERSPAEGQSIVLVTDAAARQRGKPYWCAIAELSGQVVPVSKKAWETYGLAIEGLKDLKRERPDVDVRHWLSGKAPGPSDIGTALGPGRRSAQGQVIWVRVDAGEIDAISLSALWRSPGQHSVGDRMHAQQKPCQSFEELCPACQIFGSAETERDADVSAQLSYRGHIRFSDALLTKPDGSAATSSDLDRAQQLAPLMSPKPSAGQFYLQNKKTTRASHRNQSPTSHWGSEADKTNGEPTPRPIRGRKHYWHGLGREGQQRFKARGTNDDVQPWVDLARDGYTLRARIRFDNLTPAQLGGLLAAVQPSLLANEFDGARTRLGGGKPLGLGTVNPRIEGLEAQTGAARYRGQLDEAAGTPEDFIAEFSISVGAEAKEVWADLAAVLRPGHVPEELIWYPPGTAWSGDPRNFDESFEFFTKSGGRYTDPKKLIRPHENELVPLRDPSAPDQRLPIDPAVEQEAWWTP